MSYYVSRSSAPVHVWDEDAVVFHEPLSWRSTSPYYDPISDPLCGKSTTDHETDPMEDCAASIKDFLQGDRNEYICPGCILALERRHKLPDSYRTDALDERISEWRTAQSSQVDYPPDESDPMKPVGTDGSVGLDRLEPRSKLTGLPTKEEVQRMISEEPADKPSPPDISELSITDFTTDETDLQTDALDAAVEGTAGFSGTVVQVNPVILDSGHRKVVVTDEETLGESDVRLGEDMTVPITSVSILHQRSEGI